MINKRLGDYQIVSPPGKDPGSWDQKNYRDLVMTTHDEFAGLLGCLSPLSCNAIRNHRIAVSYFLSSIFLLTSVLILNLNTHAGELERGKDSSHIRSAVQIMPLDSSAGSQSNSLYYPMDNIHVVAVRPGGKELYAYTNGDPFNVILVVRIDPADYQVIGIVYLPPAKKVMHSYISFSPDGRHAYLTRMIDCQFEERCDAPRQIIVINTETKQVEAAIPVPFNPMEVVIPSIDGKLLYFIAMGGGINIYGIAILDLEKQQVVNYFPLEGVNFITMSSDGKWIYATQGYNFYGARPLPGCVPPNLFSVIDVQTFKVVFSVPVGDGPRYIAATPDGKKAYVMNQWSNNTSVIDLERRAVTTTMNVGADRSAVAITPDGKKAYITLPGSGKNFQFSNSVVVVDVEKDLVLGIIPVHLEPITIAIDPDGTRAYVPDGNANGANPSEAHVIDTVNDVYLRPIILRPASYYMPTGIDITPDATMLFVVSEGGVENTKSTTRLLAVNIATHNFVTFPEFQARGARVSRDGTKVYVFCPQTFFVLDRETMKVTKSVDLSAVFPSPPTYFDQSEFAIALDGKEETAYLFGRSNEIVVVDIVKSAVVAQIPFEKQPIEIEHGLALTPDGGKLFVSDYISQSVVVIDTASRTVSARIPMEARPVAIRISKDGKRVYVTSGASVVMLTVFATDTYGVLNKYPLSVSAPRGFELSADERYAYVTDFDPNILIIYDLLNSKVVKVLYTDVDPFSMVASPDKRYLYITNFTSDSISVFDTQTNQMLTPIVFLPPPPSPLSPSNGAASVPTNPTFSWQYSGETVAFGLQVSTSKDFSTVEVEQNKIFGASYSMRGLRNDVNYYWRVNVTSAGGTGAWSPAYSFRTVPAKFISGGGAASVLTAGNGSSTQSGYAVASVTSGDAPYGVAVLSFKQNGVTVSEAGVPASPPTTHARIFIDFRSNAPALPAHSEAGLISTDTGIAVVNCGSGKANVTYTLRDLNGSILNTGHGTIAAGNHFAKFIDEFKEIASDFNFPSGFQFGSLEIAADQPVSILALRMTTNQRNDVLFTTTPVADLTKPVGYDTMYFPQFADGGGYTTSLILLNTTTSTERGVLQILDNNGMPFTVNQVGGATGSSFNYSIPPGGVFRFQTDGLPEQTKAGWVRLVPGYYSQAPVASGLFGFNIDRVLVSESGIPAANPTTHARVYVDLSENHNVGLAIANSQPSEARIAIGAFQNDGVTAVGTSPDPLKLAGNGHDAKFANDFVSGLPAGFTGVLDISSTTPFAALTVRSLSNERHDFLMTTFPVADQIKAAPSPIMFPQIADGGGYVTQFIFLSSGRASTLALDFYGEDGKVLDVGK